MGTTEAVGATALGGLIYAAFSGQPITIIGTTGPLLAFLKVLHSTCVSRGIPFLPVYAWTGLWSAFFLLLSSVFSVSNIVEYLTQFTDDIFSALISIIFIFEAVVTLRNNFVNPAIPGIQATAALICALTTYSTATVLKKVRQTNLFPRKLRGLISDFAPTLGVLAGTAVAYAAMGRYGFSLPTLNVPELLGTTSGRPWVVDLFSVSNKIKLMTFFPALMATILLFMDQNITVRLVADKRNKLKKGSGYHLDMLVISFITALTSVLGMPWMVAATVRSLAHLRSLNEYDAVTTVQEVDKEGATATEEVTKMEFVGVQEQRVTGLLIHGLIGSALMFGRPLLRKLPVSVLTGLFLYLGTSSIGTTELWQRSLLFITDARDAPKSAWKEIVGLNRTKIFTAIQLFLLYGMWWIKGTKLGVFFPVLIGLLGPVRIMLEKMKIFTPKELEALDGEL